MICAPDGGIIDDLIVYRLGRDRFLVVANAATRAVVSDALAERLAGGRAVLDDRSLATGARRDPGPALASRSSRRSPTSTSTALRYYAIAEGHVAGHPGAVARTGYTGEDGFELFVDDGAAGELWDALLDAGRDADGVAGRPRRARHAPPRGRACRSTATSSTATTNPFEAGLGRVVKLDKPGDFVGRAALEKVAARRARRSGSSGCRSTGRGIARHGYPVLAGERRDRRRHQRHAVADPRRAHRDGVRRAGRCRAGYDARRRDPRRAGPRAGRPAAVLPEARSPDVSRARADLRYTKDHEWVRVDGDEATVGITDYAADQLGDVVFVELPAVGKALEAARDVRRRRVGQGRERPVRARRAAR